MGLFIFQNQEGIHAVNRCREWLAGEPWSGSVITGIRGGWPGTELGRDREMLPGDRMVLPDVSSAHPE